MMHETLEYLGIAFVSSVLLIIMSKIILQALIRKPADYYDAEELLQEELMLNAAGVSITNEHETDPEGEPIEATHLEAHIEGIEPAEPEEIITEIPEAVHESIEIIPHDEQEDIVSASGELTDIEEPDELIEIEETEDYIDLPEKETAPEPEPIPEPESVPEEQEEEPAPEPESEEPAEETPEPEQESIPEPEPAAEEPAEDKEPDYTFKIKAKTSRTKRPKRKEDEERAEEEAAARAAMEAAQAAADDRVPGWTESYADIRSSLEKAFLADAASDTDTEKADADAAPATDTEIADADAAPEKNSDDNNGTDDNNGKKKNNRNRKRNRKPKPSMKMNKKELTDIAESRGIKVPEEATKREILDLIYAETDRSQN